jgi:hypothetical protein
MNIDANRYSEMSQNISKARRGHMPEDINIHTHNHENLKSHVCAHDFFPFKHQFGKKMEHIMCILNYLYHTQS